MIPLHCQKPINFLIFRHDNRKTKNQKEVQNFLNPVTIAIIAAVAAAVVFGVVGFVLGEVHRKKVAECAIGYSYGGSYQNRKSGCSDSGK